MEREAHFRFERKKTGKWHWNHKRLFMFWTRPKNVLSILWYNFSQRRKLNQLFESWILAMRLCNWSEIFQNVCKKSKNCKQHAQLLIIIIFWASQFKCQTQKYLKNRAFCFISGVSTHHFVLRSFSSSCCYFFLQKEQ